MRGRRANAIYLPDVHFPDGLEPIPSLDEALDGATLVVSAVPTHGVVQVIRAAAPRNRSRHDRRQRHEGGIDADTLLRVSELLDRELQRACPIVVLSGPSFACRAGAASTAVCVASHDRLAAERVQSEPPLAVLRLYATDDVIGVEVGGALKNVIAIAAGVVEDSASVTTRSRRSSRVGSPRSDGSRPRSADGAIRWPDWRAWRSRADVASTLSRNRHVGIELPTVVRSRKSWAA